MIETDDEIKAQVKQVILLMPEYLALQELREAAWKHLQKFSGKSLGKGRRALTRVYDNLQIEIDRMSLWVEQQLEDERDRKDIETRQAARRKGL